MDRTAPFRARPNIVQVLSDENLGARPRLPTSELFNRRPINHAPRRLVALHGDEVIWTIHTMVIIGEMGMAHSRALLA